MTSVRRFRFLHFVRTRLWLLPLICVLTGIGGAVALLAIDKASGYSVVGEGVTGSASSAQSILSVASSALVTLTTVVLSLTLVAVQLAMASSRPGSCARSCMTAAASLPSACSSARSPTR